jgi:hypothetical protein
VAREGARGHESPAPEPKPKALEGTAGDKAAQPEVRGEYAEGTDASDDDLRERERERERELELVRRDASKAERLAEWYVARPAGDPRYGDAADALLALAIVLGDLADALEAEDKRA